LLFIDKLPAGGLAIKSRFDGGAGGIDSAIPCAGLSAQDLQVRYAPPTQALSREHSNFNFGLVEPTPMLGSVMNRETIPVLGG